MCTVHGQTIWPKIECASFINVVYIRPFVGTVHRRVQKGHPEWQNSIHEYVNEKLLLLRCIIEIRPKDFIHHRTMTMQMACKQLLWQLPTLNVLFGLVLVDPLK